MSTGAGKLYASSFGALFAVQPGDKPAVCSHCAKPIVEVPVPLMLFCDGGVFLYCKDCVRDVTVIEEPAHAGS